MTAEALNTKIIQLKPQLENYAYSLTKDETNGKDLVQQTMLKAFDKIHQFRQGTNLKAWLFTIMRNNFINDIRKNSRFVGREEITSYIPYSTKNMHVENTGESSVMLEMLEKEVESLPDNLKIPFRMMVDGYAYKEIAAELRMPLGSVKSFIHKARKRLQARVLYLRNYLVERKIA